MVLTQPQCQIHITAQAPIAALAPPSLPRPPIPAPAPITALAPPIAALTPIKDCWRKLSKSFKQRLRQRLRSRLQSMMFSEFPLNCQRFLQQRLRPSWQTPSLPCIQPMAQPCYNGERSSCTVAWWTGYRRISAWYISGGIWPDAGKGT